ncbi:MAG: tripartite tricarboxylate transporter TctB family protein [Burkholderiales bacterium]
MRAGFLLAILLVSGGYTWLAFGELDYLSSARRLGPGFFPRILGVSLVVLSAVCLFEEIRSKGEALSAHWRTTIVVAALSAAFVVLLEPLGALLSMVAFLGAALAYLNRGRPVQNALLALILPACLYLLFKVWLNASLPRGILPL